MRTNEPIHQEAIAGQASDDVHCLATGSPSFRTYQDIDNQTVQIIKKDCVISCSLTEISLETLDDLVDYITNRGIVWRDFQNTISDVEPNDLIRNPLMGVCR